MAGTEPPPPLNVMSSPRRRFGNYQPFAAEPVAPLSPVTSKRQRSRGPVMVLVVALAAAVVISVATFYHPVGRGLGPGGKHHLPGKQRHGAGDTPGNRHLKLERQGAGKAASQQQQQQTLAQEAEGGVEAVDIAAAVAAAAAAAKHHTEATAVVVQEEDEDEDEDRSAEALQLNEGLQDHPKVQKQEEEAEGDEDDGEEVAQQQQQQQPGGTQQQGSSAQQAQQAQKMQQVLEALSLEAEGRTAGTSDAAAAAGDQPADRQAAAAAGDSQSTTAAATADAQSAATADAQAAAGQAGSSGGSTPSTPSAYQQALQGCTDLACLKAAAKQERHPGQFLFPHFIILGWQKCATTSLFRWLGMHPQALPATAKEPEFFSEDCEYDPLHCPAGKQAEYIKQTLQLDAALASNLQRAAYEGSTHYGKDGQRLAAGMAKVFPWVKLIISMREPISRSISMLAHNLDKRSVGCLARRDSYECLKDTLPTLSYADPFQAWMEAYPRDQVLLLQYENLTRPEHMTDNLKEVNSFLGLQQGIIPLQLEEHNTRAQRLGEQPQGWPMLREQYERLIKMVRPDAERMAALAEKYGYTDAKHWMHNWEAAWTANLNRCSMEGRCEIQVT